MEGEPVGSLEDFTDGVTSSYVAVTDDDGGEDAVSIVTKLLRTVESQASLGK